MLVSTTQYLHRSEYYIFYYRRAIPDELRKAFGGKREIKKSLKTRDKSLAILQHHELNLKGEKLFIRLRRGMLMSGNMDPSIVIGIKQDAVSVAKEGETEAVWSGIVLALRGQPLRFDSGRPVSAAPIKMSEDKLLRIDGSEVTGMTIATALAYADSVGIPKMVDESVYMPEDLMNVSVEWVEPTDKESAIQAKNNEDQLRKMGLLDDYLRLTSGAIAAQVPTTVHAPETASLSIENEQTAKPKKKAPVSIRYSKLVRKFLIHQTNWGEDTKEASRKIFEIFLDLNGDIDVSEIDHPMMMDFIETVQSKIPSNAKKVFPHLSFKEISRLDHEKAGRKMMSASNVNKYISRHSQLFDYAVNRGYMDYNYAQKKRLKEPTHPKDQRDRFSNEEIKRMFSEVEPWASNNRTKPENFWINLIGAFSGARLGEICQLRSADVYEETDGNATMWVFDINMDEQGMRVKTRNSIRQVPVHSQLIKMGFLDYVIERRASGKELLWDLTPDTKGKWSGKMSKRYAYLFKKMGFSDPFHSWRHTVSDILMKNADVRKEAQEALVGHALEGESYGRYGKGFSLIILKATVEAIKYDVDMSHLEP